MKRLLIISLTIVMCLNVTSCNDFLDEELPGDLAPETLLSDQGGVESVLYSAYLKYRFQYGFHAAVMENYEYPCDILFQTGGGMNINFQLMSNFNWSSTQSTANGSIWNTRYSSIRDVNIVIDNIDVLTDEVVKTILLAEARFIRAVNYYYLYDAFGPVPIRTSSSDDPNLTRPTDADFLSFLEQEFIGSAADLPNPGDEIEYGRATNGAALGYLIRLYMLTKQWQNAADAAQQVMNLGYYELFPSYRDLFKVENEPDKNSANREMIIVATNTTIHPFGNKISAPAQPPGFASTPEIPEFTASGIANWAAQFRLYDSFVDSFEPDDTRKSLIFSTYMNGAGNMVDLTTTPDNRRTLKFFDNGAVVASHGNDFPMLRYADILLMRAEALNELSGPIAEAVDLVNQVRTRAGLANLDAASFTQESLRDHILDERGWEFYYEGLRRTDLIRHGKFIEKAQARGVTNAADFHVLFPIPQAEIDANINMTQEDQNPGY